MNVVNQVRKMRNVTELKNGLFVDIWFCLPPNKVMSIEEVERLNTPRPRNPSICSADHGRSSSEEDCRRPLSRVRNPADGIPAPETSSESDSHDSFTCSEMEYEREKPAAYTSRVPKLSQVNESDADDED